MSLIDKIKALFAADEAETKENKFLDAKLVDGTIIRTDAEEFKPGDKLSVLTESGEIVKAPEGMHEVEDGTVIVVDAEGIITEVRKPEVKEEMEETAPETAEKTEEVMEIAPEEDKVYMLEMRVEALEQAMTMLIENLEMKKTEMDSVKKENESLKTELSKTPAAKPVNVKKTEIAPEKPTSRRFSKANKMNVNSDLVNKVSELRNK